MLNNSACVKVLDVVFVKIYVNLALSSTTVCVYIYIYIYILFFQ